ncbi:MAG: FxsA family protein [Actinomycetota bacterium]|jgi:UPF0716 protein FxsA
MGVLLFVAFIVIPLAELYVIIQVGEQIGLPLTIVALIAVSVIGTVLVKREGTATYFRAREVLAKGGIPNKELTDGFLILLGGALLLTPGFLTDITGLILIFPPTRAPLKRFFRTIVFGKLAKRYPMVAGGMYSAKVVKEKRGTPRRAEDARVWREPDDTKPSRDSSPAQLPPRQAAPPDEGDSRDRV